jgi:hypothetical protein
MKTCFKCGETKLLDNFYAHPFMADGHLGKCKSCCLAYAKQERLTNPLIRARDRERSKTPIRKAHISRNTIKWNLKNPEGYRAHYTLRNGIRDGKIERKTCEICGDKAHAHHSDYSKPFDVQWLCALHHHRHHAFLNKSKESED